MTELEEWYHENRLRVEKMGIELSLPPGRLNQYIDGEYGRYMFRFIDRGNLKADIEIIDAVSGETVYHNLGASSVACRSIYDAAIDFIAGLAQ